MKIFFSLLDEIADTADKEERNVINDIKQLFRNYHTNIRFNAFPGKPAIRDLHRLVSLRDFTMFILKLPSPLRKDMLDFLSAEMSKEVSACR